MTALAPLCPVRLADPAACTVNIDNIRQIFRVYGPYAAAAVHAAVRQQILEFLPRETAIEERGQSGFVFCLGNEIDAPPALETLLSSVGVAPVQHSGMDIHPVLSASLECAADPVDAEVDTSGEWEELYRRDMALASRLFTAMREDRLRFAWQPVCDSYGGARALYHEGLLRIVRPDGGLDTPSPYIAALERLGLIRALDRHVVLAGLAELRRNPGANLGVNVSARSALADCWWASAIAELARQPDLARRLVIEITESARFVSTVKAREFVNGMRRLGCSIAIDDFGMGHSSLRTVMALQPDILKVDAFYIRWASLNEATGLGMCHLFGFLRTIAPVVVAEGVRSEAQCDAMRRAGALWQQGRYHEAPTDGLSRAFARSAPLPGAGRAPAAGTPRPRAVPRTVTPFGRRLARSFGKAVRA